MPGAWKVILCVVVGYVGLILIDGTHDSIRGLANVHRYARETAVIGAIRTLHTAQVKYYSQFGRYATSLTGLGQPAAGLIDAELASGTKSGYKFTLTGTASGYAIHASPVAFGVSGRRTFYSDQSMVLRQNFGQEPATSNSRK